MVSSFLKSRRQGLSPRTIESYDEFLNRASCVIGIDINGKAIKAFLDGLSFSNGGKHGYYRALRAFYNWLYSPKSSLGLNPQDNPILLVDAPKVEKKILPSLSLDQLNYLIEQAECIRDKAIISLFADSGLRLSEIAGINPKNIDWKQRLIKVRCKGNREGYAPFGDRTENLLRQWLQQYTPNGSLWDLNDCGGLLQCLEG